MNLSVFGLGKLGAPLAAVLASRHHEVIGYDVDPVPVELLKRGKEPVAEPGLADLIRSSSKRLSATTDPDEAVLGSELTFVVVPTPSDSTGAFSTRFVLEAGKKIGRALQGKSGYHLVVLTSTVMPGATGAEFVPCLEAAAGKRCGRDFGVCYNPEFVALGSVIRDMLNPDFVLIGESDPAAGELLAGLYRGVCEPMPPVARLNFVNAELTKLAVNQFVTMKISFANTLAEICERLPSADVDAVTAAIGLDSRIGKKYLKGAVGYGGPCFPRDTLAFARLAHQAGVGPDLAVATDRINRRRLDDVVAKIAEHASRDTRIGILGLSYKPATVVTEESQGLALADRLARQGWPVVVYDPAAMENARKTLGESVQYAHGAGDAARRCDVLVIMTAWDEFRRLSAEDLRPRHGDRRKIVVDCWRLLDGEGLVPVADVIHLGRGGAAPARN